MGRLMVGMGEIGVMYPGNSGLVTSMVTIGASPCIILGIRKGTTALLAHIHRANNLFEVKKQLQAILADAVSVTTPAQSFIATQAFTGTKTDDGKVQGVMIMLLRKFMDDLGIDLTEVNQTKPAAAMNLSKHALFGDNDRLAIGPEEAQSVQDWTMAYDKRFQGKTGMLPMAIRVGINSENAEAAVSRLYPNVTTV